MEICMLHEKVKQWMGWCKIFAKSKTRIPSSVEKGQNTNLSQHKDKGHLDVIISQHYAYFEWSKLARWTWQNLQSAEIENFEQVPSYIEFVRKF